MAQSLNLTYDLAEWPWHYDGTTQVDVDVRAKYQRRTSIGIGDMNNFRNFNANLETLT